MARPASRQLATAAGSPARLQAAPFLLTVLQPVAPGAGPGTAYHGASCALLIRKRAVHFGER
jgi:hypothetical protein